MKTGAIASLLAVGRRAWAQPTEQNMAAFAGAAPVPKTELDWVLSEAKTTFPNLDLNKFELVVRSLWTHFHIGLGKIGVWSDSALLRLMYDEPLMNGLTKTGSRVAENVANGKFDPLGNDYQTNVCAYLVGHKAALAVLAKPGKDPDPKITPEIYQAARSDVEREMSKKLLRARGPGGPSGGLGFGC
jgi:hypothetical protein